MRDLLLLNEAVSVVVVDQKDDMVVRDKTYQTQHFRGNITRERIETDLGRVRVGWVGWIRKRV